MAMPLVVVGQRRQRWAQRLYMPIRDAEKRDDLVDEVCGFILVDLPQERGQPGVASEFPMVDAHRTLSECNVSHRGILDPTRDTGLHSDSARTRV